ncbi:MAG: ferredoxin:protochlorophyllide reductase (ATP-dependent) subunit B, partial [Parvibaculum sp.]
LVMGLEEHLLTMFREDFEFSDEAGPSHHAAHSPSPARIPVHDEPASAEARVPTRTDGDVALAEPQVSEARVEGWTDEAERELKKIPFFVRGKARRNTEAFARDHDRWPIDVETLYEAKAHYAR